jgi:hypothetical protein
MLRQFRINKLGLFALLAIAALSSCGLMTADGQKLVRMDEMKADWSRQCFGRHIVQLPKDIRIVQNYALWGDAIELQPAMKGRDVPFIVEKREAELRALPHESQGSLFKRRVKFSGESMGVQSWMFRDLTRSQKLETWLVSPNSTRVWKHVNDLSSDKEEEAIAYISSLARTIRSREPGEVPTGPGFCIEAGVVGGSEFQSEEYLVYLSFPNMPRVSVKLFSLAVGEPQQKLLDRVPAGMATLANLFTGASTLRRGDKAINGIEGQELLLAIRAEGKRGYSFRWESPGKAQSMASPHLAIEMSTMNVPDSAGHVADSFFKSDEEAILFWDAIVSSFKVRPGAI